MRLREMVSVAMILGMVAVAGADDRPANVEPAAASGKLAKSTAAGPPVEPPKRPNPDTASSEAAGPAAAPEAAEDTEQMPPHIVGPQRVDLGNHTAIDLPEGMVLFERAEAQAMLRKGGSSPDGVVAMVFKPGSEWSVFIEYAGVGYVDDSDADELDADELLESYREGTSEQNKTRTSLGFPALVVDGWTEPPRYEQGPHHLVWGLAVHDTDSRFVNFFTRILGRHGYLSIDLIDAPERIEASKQEALAVLEATRFEPGSTYADHSSSDPSSGIGLRGLVLGSAGLAVASKLGVLAKFLVVFKKLFIVVLVAVGGLFRWLFRRRSRVADAVGAPPPSPDGAAPPRDDAAPPADGSTPATDGSTPPIGS